jgi:hypothetical protein
LATNADLLSWLTTSTHETMDAAVGGAFLSLNLRDAIDLVEKMASNQS